MYIALTIVFGLLLLALWGGIIYAFYAVVWKPSKAEKALMQERLRHLNDRRG